MQQSHPSNLSQLSSPKDYLLWKASRLDSPSKVACAALELAWNLDSNGIDGRVFLPLVFGHDLLAGDLKVQYIAGTSSVLGSPITQAEEVVLDKIECTGGTVRVSQTQSEGIQKQAVYSLYRKRALHKVVRGVYRTYSAEQIHYPDMFYAAASCPKGVICLTSALDYHELTDQIPRKVHLAIPAGARTPTVDWPPARFHRFSQETYESGVDRRILGGIEVKIFSREKTIADCFKFRSKVGLDVAVEGLQRYLRSGKINIPELMKQCRVCRVDNVITPYLLGAMTQ